MEKTKKGPMSGPAATEKVYSVYRRQNTLTHLATTRVIHELHLASLRADGRQSGFELREHAERFCEFVVDLWNARAQRVLTHPAVFTLKVIVMGDGDVGQRFPEEGRKRSSGEWRTLTEVKESRMMLSSARQLLRPSRSFSCDW